MEAEEVADEAEEEAVAVVAVVAVEAATRMFGFPPPSSDDW